MISAAEAKIQSQNNLLNQKSMLAKLRVIEIKIKEAYEAGAFCVSLKETFDANIHKYLIQQGYHLKQCCFHGGGAYGEDVYGTTISWS